MSPSGADVSFRSILRHRSFRFLWLGQIVSNAGDFFYHLAVLIMVNRLTGSTLAIGVTMIAISLPQLLFGPIGGVFADRVDRRRLMIASDLVRSILVLPCILVQEPSQIWIFAVAGFLQSAVSQFFNPTKSAIIPQLVSRDELLSANALSQTTQVAAMLFGPALAGFVIGFWGSRPAFIVDSLSFLLSAVFISRIHPTPLPDAAGQQDLGSAQRNFLREMRDGFRQVAESSTVSGLVAMMTVIMLGIGAINVLWVPFLDREFGVGPEGLGIVDSVQGVGMLIGSVFVGNLAARFRYSRLLAVSIIFIGLCMAATGLAPSFLAVLAITLFLGLSIPPAESALMTLLQLSVPAELLGRVNGTMSAISSFAYILSMAGAAALAEWMGLRAVYVLCGSVIISSSFIALRYIRDPVDADTPGAESVIQKATVSVGSGEGI